MLAQVLRDRPVWEEWTEPASHPDTDAPPRIVLFRDDEDDEDEDFIEDPSLDEEDEEIVEDDDFLDDDLDEVEADEDYDDDEDEDL